MMRCEGPPNPFLTYKLVLDQGFVNPESRWHSRNSPARVVRGCDKCYAFGDYGGSGGPFLNA